LKEIDLKNSNLEIYKLKVDLQTNLKVINERDNAIVIPEKALELHDNNLAKKLQI